MGEAWKYRATPSLKETDMPGRLRFTLLGVAALCLTLLVVPTGAPARHADAVSAGLSFGPAQPADPQRDEGEPNIEIDAAGRIYTCGPTGFVTGADYAQVSTDGGDQFHLLGEPPRGQLADRGGGDCYLASAKKKNANGTYTLSYVGLADSDFTSARSDNDGASFAGSASSCSGLTDRQWTTFLDDKTAFLIYNDIAGGTVAQKSVDGGLNWTGYGACGDAAKKTIAPSADFPGPLKADTNGAHNATHPGTPLMYAGYNDGNNVRLALSLDAGDSWQDCLVAKTAKDPSNGFVVVDHDTAGNLYISWGEKGPKAGDFHTKFSWLPLNKLAQCSNVDVNPGWSTPVQVDAPPSRSLVFPWLAASGLPGRVAITWYGSTTLGVADAGSFKGPWDVYVAQSTNALDASPSWQQIKASTHPMHYDQVCLSGLACTLGGDRSLADFFAMALDPVTKRLVIVFDESGKVPDASSGPVAIPNVLVQNTGPSNLGGTVQTRREVVRTQSADPKGDAQAPYSAASLALPVAPPPASRRNQPALDITSVQVSRQVDLTNGKPITPGGFTVTLKVAGLSRSALLSALSGARATSLIWAFRWINGYQPAALSVHWDPVRGFGGGFDNFATGSATCISVPGVNGYEPKCLTYPGQTPVPMSIDVAAGVIRLSAPRSVLKTLGPPDSHGRPSLVAANSPGSSRFYSGTAFTMGNPSINEAQGFLYPVDGSAAYDFVLPAGSGLIGSPGSGSPGPGAPGKGAGGLAATGGLGWPAVAAVLMFAASIGLRLRRRRT